MPPVNYFDLDTVINAKIPELAPNEGDEPNEKDAERLEGLCLAVSVFIDNYCKRPAGYFATAGDTATARGFRGEGKDYLRIPQHVAGAVSVAGIASTAYYESDQNGWLYANGLGGPTNGDDDYFASCSGQFWEDGRRYMVTTKWGFDATPPDILEAGMQIIAHIYSAGEGIIGDVTPTGFIIERAMPLTAAAMLKPWIKRPFEIT